MTKKWYAGLIALVAAGVIFGVAAVAQQIPGAIKLTSWANPFGIVTAGPGPQSTFLLASGGTFVCTGGGTITIGNTNVDAGSAVVITLKTVGGTVATPTVSTITVATGFTVVCGASDTSTYNYVVIG
jgi:hypothetical protein